MPNQRKRSRPDDGNQLGVGSTLALLRNEQAQDGADAATGELFNKHHAERSLTRYQEMERPQGTTKAIGKSPKVSGRRKSVAARTKPMNTIEVVARMAAPKTVAALEIILPSHTRPMPVYRAS
jgi:hypothetical protein